MLDEEQYVDYATGAAIAIVKRVYGFKLVMAHGHADEWVNFCLVMQKTLPVGQQLTQLGLTFGRCIDHFASAMVSQLSAGHAANVHVCGFQGAADFHSHGGAQRTRLQ